MADDDLERRLAAVERTLEPGGDDHATGERRDGTVEERLDALESRVDELDAAVQAARGFLGGVSAVNEAVERRADAAVAAVERLETRLDGERIDDHGLDSPSSEGFPPRGDSADDHPPEGNRAGDDSDEGLRERLRDLR